MLNKTVLVNVTNISDARVGYDVPEIPASRRFNPGEMKQISVGELRALEFIEGGSVLIRNFLRVDNEDFLKELGVTVEPEYFWSRDDVVELLMNGSIEQVQDALDFAPQGIIDLIKEVAVTEQINDMSKREAIRKATGFNVTQAIELTREEVPKEPEEKAATRRTEKKDEPQARRTAPMTSKYKRVE
jgi:hypothetical protein